MRLGAKIFGALSGILLLYLLVGFLLPGTWRAEQEALLPAPPALVFPLLNRLSSWTLWTPFPETGLEPFGPPEGAGAGLRWDDPAYGKGEARIIAARRDSLVEYGVEVEGGSLRIRGRLSLEAEGEGTRIRWVEEGDFGWNPLLGFTARGMASSQGEAMKASLSRLAAAVAAQNSDAPDSGPTDGLTDPGRLQTDPSTPR